MRPIVTIAGPDGAVSRDTIRHPEDAAASHREFVGIGAHSSAGSLASNKQDLAFHAATPPTDPDRRTSARIEDAGERPSGGAAATIARVSALLRQSFGARITDTIRPMNATYGARHSWHKAGQAIDFVPSGGVGTIDGAQVRALMARHGIRLIELFGPGDRGHANHWHVAFARLGQVGDNPPHIEGDEDWHLDVAAGSSHPALEIGAPSASAQVTAVTTSPPAWDVFAVAEWRASRGSGS